MREFDLRGFKDEINTKEKVAVFFYADWAAPSRFMNEVAEKAFKAAEVYFVEHKRSEPSRYAGGFSCGQMEVDENKELLYILGVTAVPTFCLIEKGAVKELVEGYLPETELTKRLTEFIG